MAVNVFVRSLEVAHAALADLQRVMLIGPQAFLFVSALASPVTFV